MYLKLIDRGGEQVISKDLVVEHLLVTQNKEPFSVFITKDQFDHFQGWKPRDWKNVELNISSDQIRDPKTDTTEFRSKIQLVEPVAYTNRSISLLSDAIALAQDQIKSIQANDDSASVEESYLTDCMIQDLRDSISSFQSDIQILMNHNE